MVTTRRQSGVVSKAAVSKALEVDDLDIDPASDDDEQALSESSEGEDDDDDDDDDDDFGPARKPRKSAVESQNKRRKVATGKGGGTAARSAAQPAKRRRKDLSFLLTMPLDILFEVLGRLQPKDLFNLVRTNKMFQETLFSRKARGVWKAAREAYDAPPPPGDFSELKWTALLFGNTCQTCGTRGIQNVEWHLRRRVCLHCKKRHMVFGGRFKSKFPDYQVEILEYIPYTNVSPWAQGEYAHSGSKYYWDDDIHTLAKKYNTLHHAAYLGHIGAKAAFEEWKKERKGFVESVLAMVSTYENWKDLLEDMKDEEAQDNIEKRLEGVKLRFLELGYTRIDIDKAITIRSDGIISGTPNVTNAVWTRLRPKLEPALKEALNKRLEAEFKSTVLERMALFRMGYAAYLSKLRPSESYCCPPAEAFLPLPGVRDYVEAEKDVDVTAKDFQPVINNLAEHITRYQEDKRQAVLDAIAADDPGATGQASDPLELARYVFECQERQSTNGLYMGRTPPSRERVYIGWPMIASLSALSEETKLELRNGVTLPLPRVVRLSPRLSKTALSLIQLVGLDPNTAKQVDMDMKDARFICIADRNCTGRSSFANTIDIMTWRGALCHVTAMFGTNWVETKCRFVLATPEQTTLAKAHRSVTTVRESTKMWSCNHCCQFIGINEAGRKADVLEHLRADHGIPESKMSEDYFINERCRLFSEEPVMGTRPPKPDPPTLKGGRKGGSLDTRKNVLCLQCKNTKDMNRLFIQSGVEAHLKAKHSVFAPKLGVHFKIDPRVK